MLPIRVASSGFVKYGSRGVLFLLLCGLFVPLGQAGPLPALEVEQFRILILPTNEPRPIDTSAIAPALTAYRHKLRQSAQDLPSLGEVARVLLLSEWSSAELDSDTTVPLDQVKQAVRETNDEKFQRDVQKLVAMAGDNPDDVTRSVVSEIKRETRLLLLDRLETRMRFYLTSERDETRIAAANLMSDIMRRSIRQEAPDPKQAMTTDRVSVPSARHLHQRLRDLAGDVRKLLASGNSQVQVAGARALSELGIPPAELATALKPMFTSTGIDVATRRATADALAHMLEQSSAQIEGGRPSPSLQVVEKILPVAVLGLDDSDPEVRGRSLNACRRAALILDDLASDPQMPPDRRTAFADTLRVVDTVLPKLTAAARDEVPALRVAACRTLETFALAALRVRVSQEQRLPPPSPDKSKELDLPKEENKKKGVSLPSTHGGKRLSARQPSQWAATRLDKPSAIPQPLPAIRESGISTVTLEAPIRLQDANSTIKDRSQPSDTRFSTSNNGMIRPVSFAAWQAHDLPSPTPVGGPWKQTVQTMITNLSDPDYRVRLGAVDVLETLGDRAEPAIPALVKALEDTNKFVRWASARTLGRFAMRPKEKNDALYSQYAEDIVTGLMAQLKDSEDPSVRITAAYALEQYGAAAKKAVPHLARVINRGDRDYILAILHTIQGIGTDAAPALPNVAWILSDRTQPTSVRIEAAHTLGRFGELAKTQPRVLSTLRDIELNDTDPDVRNAASTAILSIERPKK